MLQEEEEREMIFFSSSYPDHPHSTMDSPNKVFSSKLNPDAPEFIPTTHKKGKAQPFSLVQNYYIIQTWVAFNCIEPCLSFMERKNLQKNDNTPNILVYLGDCCQVEIFVSCTFPMTCSTCMSTFLHLKDNVCSLQFITFMHTFSSHCFKSALVKWCISMRNYI